VATSIQTPGSTTNVAAGWVTRKAVSEFWIRRGLVRPSTIIAVGTERGSCRKGETPTVTEVFGKPASVNDARKRLSGRRGRNRPTPRPIKAAQQVAMDGDLTSEDMCVTLELQVDLK
jgi:hypothetical protein